MADVEKVARDIADAMFFGPHKPDCEIPEDQTMQVRYGHAVKVIRDALVAMGDREAVALSPLVPSSPEDDDARRWVVQNLTSIRRDDGSMGYTLLGVIRAYQAGKASVASPRPEAVGEAVADLIDRMLPYLEETEDEGPDGYGWKSAKLHALIREAEAMAAAIRSGETP